MQRNCAKARGIAWEFTYPLWVRWWKRHLGAEWMNLRGRGKDRYCMARYGDAGSYRWDNVQCILFGENCRQIRRQKKPPKVKLTAEQRREIRRRNLAMIKMSRRAMTARWSEAMRARWSVHQVNPGSKTKARLS